MRETPFYLEDGTAQKGGCFANLVSTDRIMVARYDKKSIISISKFPKSISDFKLIINDVEGGDTGLTKKEEVFFASRLWQLMTSSYERRNADYERIGWWDYLEADRFSEAYKSLLVEGLTRTLVAANAKTASTKTGGNIFLQLIFNMLSPGVNTDRVLNGPTNDVWLNPWLDYLVKSGVVYRFGHKVDKIHFDGEKITAAEVTDEQNKTKTIKADYFILATPVEQAAPLLNDSITSAAPSTKGISALAKDTAWMNGIQYYLNRDVKITKGHCIYSNSEWAITSISQIQFWKNYDLKDRYNGRIKGVLSVDVSDWLQTKYKGKLASNCTPDEVADLVWEQLERSLNVNGKKVLDKSMIEFHYVDRDIQWKKYEFKNVDKEPLLVNRVNTWELRPEAYCDISNLFFASDYVRTHTDLATMEGANEAARRAVNALLDNDHSKAERCKIWPLEEPWFFVPLRKWDKKRFEKGLPYSNEKPYSLKLLMIFWGAAYLIQYGLKALLFELSSRFKKTTSK
jgi:uncharacterized protein with NAD-binding domain and iron-sulfur cluster